MSWLRRHPDGLIAAGLFVATFAVLATYAPRIGFARDEGYYFDAASRYAGWFQELARDPGAALGEPVIRRHFEVNREHPVLIKNLMALSLLAFSPEPADDGTGWYAWCMRLPAWLFAALGVALIFLFGRAVASRRAGLFAALAFILAPRHFHHAHLACFDMPVCVLWLATVMAYRKGRGSLRWGILCGVVWGLAISVKLNAFFLPVVLVLHWLLVEGRKLSISRRGIRIPPIPVAFFSMLILGPAIFFLHWPFLWHQTFERLGWYFGFHLHHVHYYWEYFGTLLTDPPFPWLYPFAVTALTLPLPTLLLAGAGLLAACGERLGHPLRALLHAMGRVGGVVTGPRAEAPHPPPWFADRHDGWLLVLNALVPLLIIAVPSVPIFGGMKHWLHAMPFLCVLAGVALDRAIQALPPRLGRLRLTPARSYAVVAPLVLLPSLLGLVHVGPYGTSYYNALAGGVAGAADLGMQRQYWSANVVGVLPWINTALPRNARVYLHEVNGECYRTYRRDGYLRRDLRMAWTVDHADWTAYQYHREFVDTEYRIWNKTGDKTIAHGLYLDEVPLILVYDTHRP